MRQLPTTDFSRPNLPDGSGDSTSAEISPPEVQPRVTDGATATPRILIVESDRLFGLSVQALACRTKPAAEFFISFRVADAAEILLRQRIDLLIVRLDMQKDDMLDFLSELATSRDRPMQTLAMVAHAGPYVLASLRSLAITAVFDSAVAQVEQFSVALNAALQGVPYWSERLLGCFIKECVPSRTTYARLALLEKLLLATCADRDGGSAALTALGIDSAKMGRLERALCRKLHVRGRIELLRMATELGFVRLVPGGFAPCGLAFLSAAWRGAPARKNRRRPTP